MKSPLLVKRFSKDLVPLPAISAKNSVPTTLFSELEDADKCLKKNNFWYGRFSITTTTSTATTTY